MKKKIDKEWAKTVWTNLHSPVVDPRSIIVNEYLGRRADQRDGVTDSGLAFAFKLKDKYREGQCLGLPGDDGWLIGPEYMFNRDLSLGHFDDSLVLAIIAARDPSNVLSLAATARLTPRATDRELVSEILTGVGAESTHPEVRDCVTFAVDQSFSRGAIEEMRHVIQDKVQDLRRECFVELKQGLTDLIESIIEPTQFVEKFLDLSEKTRIKLDVYSSMVHTLIRSKKIRPMVKLLLIENIFRMPRKVRFQVISSIREMEGDPECAYLKRELMFMLESRSQSADPRPAEAERPRMNFLFS